MLQTIEIPTAKWQAAGESLERQEGIAHLMKEDTYGFSRPVIEFLYNRGCRTGKDIEGYIENGPETERNPFDMKDMDKAITHILRAVAEQKHIVVFGDYDVDGVASTTIAVKSLKKLGAKHVDYHINSRFKEGYGISPMGVDSLLAKFPKTDFIITVDNGIVAYEGVKYAVEKGIEVLVTDHHLALPEIPEEAVAVVNPQRHDDTSEFKEICGAAVIYKVMLGVFYEAGLDLDFIYDMKDLVGMATVGDVMPLVDENRYFVREALRMIERGTRPQFQIIRQKKTFTLNEQAFGFTIVPIMNACGRLEGTPTKAMAFFLTDNPFKMEALADELIALNEERKAITTDQTDLAMAKLEAEGLRKVIVVADEHFHEGIVGLISGRLKETFNRPTIAFKDNGDTLTGSARSIEAFHMKNRLDEIKHLIVQHGGHKLAAGLTIKKENFEAFKEAINKLADEALTEEELTPVVQYDTAITPEECTRELVEEFERLRPFGQEFFEPVFLLTDVDVKKEYTMGKDKSHLKLMDGHDGMNIIMWSGVEHYKEMGKPKTVQAIGAPSLNIFRGNVSVQFMVKDANLR